MKLERFEGCWTAMVTPLNRKGEIDYEGLEKNVQFLIENGSNLVPTGTTGESPTLDWKEHDRVITKTVKLAKGKSFVIAGTGSNSTKEAFRGTKHAVEVGHRVRCWWIVIIMAPPRWNFGHSTTK